MSSRLRQVLVLTVLAAGLVAVPAPADAAGCTNAFTPAFATSLSQRYPGVRVTAAVYDTVTGCWHHLNKGLKITTASVIKAQVLGAVLLKAQDAGRGLTAWERSRILPMIRYSFNPETSELYGYVGGAAGMHATDPRFGVTSTSHTPYFGLTSTTAMDRTYVALRLLYGGGGLAQAGRAEAWRYLSNIHPVQQWGITAGVPEGWSVALKNGFYRAPGLGWRAGSSGFVRRNDADQGYAITVMTENAPNQRTGIRLVEEVSARAASALTVGPTAARPVDRARCVATSDGESWSTVAARLGLPVSRAGEVRTVAGGTSPALAGQWACSPDIPAEPRMTKSSVSGRYRPAVTDLDCDGYDDILWYAPGGGADYRWAGNPDRRFRNTSLSVNGDYFPVAGDFDGDGCGDVLWYGKGVVEDWVWYGGQPVTTKRVTVHGLGFWPVAGDFDGDGRDDVFWYGPGAVQDSISFGHPSRGAFSPMPMTVSGGYQPVVGDYDGNGAADIVWYVPGATADPVWSGRVGVRGSFASSTAVATPRARPATGDVDGDGDDELLWHGPGAVIDTRWNGLPPNHTTSPLSVAQSYLPLMGDFDGDGRDDVVWYGPGGSDDYIWWSGAGGTYVAGPLVRA